VSRAVCAARTAILAVLALFVAFGVASTAHAAGFASAEFAGEDGTAVSDGPTALYFNPAGIAKASGLDIFLGGVLALRDGIWTHAHSSTSHEAADPAGAEGANTGTAHFSNIFGAPALAATMKVHDFSFGAAFYAPFGGSLKWTPNHLFTNDQNYPLAAGGIQRWTITEGSVTHLFFTLGAATRLGPLALGITGNFIHSSVINTQAKNFAGQGDPDTSNEGRDRIDVSGIEASLGVGAMLEAVENQLWFGASYQSRPGLGGPMKLNGTMTLTFQDQVSPTPITFTHALPDILRLGIRYRPLPTFELRLFGDYTRWSAMQGQCISLRDKPCGVTATGADATPDNTTIQYLARNWKDTVGVRLGVTYRLAPGVEFISGTGFETAATPNETLDPMLPDAFNFRFSLGGRVAIGAATTLNVGVTGIYFIPRDTTGLSTVSSADTPARRADGGGLYELWLALLNVGLETQF